MKKILLLVLTLLISVGAVVAAPKPKHKKIKFNKYARYEGMAVKKTPYGQGTLYPCSRCTLTGSFYNGKITGGELSFTDHKFVISGEFTLVVSDDKQVMLVVNKGKIHAKGKKGGRAMKKNTPIKFNGDNYTFDDYYPTYPKLPKWYFESLRKFAGDKKYSRKTDGLTKVTYNNEKRTRKVVKKPTYLEVKFKKGTTANYEVSSKGSVWTRPNGDFINLTITPDKMYKITGYKVTAGKTVITHNDITHTFANGNKYTGAVKDEIVAGYVANTNLETLVSFTGVTWEWEDFEKVAGNGTIVYADGKTEKVVDGLTESEIARREEAARLEAERLEAERKAKEEAERLEAERKAKEEAERLEAEKKAQEEAAAAAAAAEAARLEAEKKAQEEAAAAAAAAEAARLEAEKKAQEEAAAAAAAAQAAAEAAAAEVKVEAPAPAEVAPVVEAAPVAPAPAVEAPAAEVAPAA